MNSMILFSKFIGKKLYDDTYFFTEIFRYFIIHFKEDTHVRNKLMAKLGGQDWGRSQSCYSGREP